MSKSVSIGVDNVTKKVKKNIYWSNRTNLYITSKYC